MHAVSTPPTASALALLPGATFADAFSLDVTEPGLNLETAARRAFGDGGPVWVRGLVAMRDAIVKPLGLKRTSEARAAASDRIDFFPCISRSPDRIVLGLDDRHLDFRIAIDATPAIGASKRISLTTVVKPHNFLGRAYLCAVMPFHKRIAPAMLGRVQRDPEAG